MSLEIESGANYAQTMRCLIILILCSLPACSTINAHHSPASNLADVVIASGVSPDTSSLVILRLSDRHRWSSNPTRAEAPYSPASTSKIPHTLIALDSGIYSPASNFIWDGVKRSFDFWNRDHTLTSAYKYSAVWVYQDIVKNLGAAVMQKYLQTFAYGNHLIGDANNLTSYWLVGPLEISINQQIVFLQKLIQHDLALDNSTYAKMRPIMREAQGQHWQLFAKTGWFSDGVNQDIGWYVGWVETTSPDNENAEHYIFAFNMDLQSPDDVPLRRQVVRNALKHINALPKNSFAP